MAQPKKKTAKKKVTSRLKTGDYEITADITNESNGRTFKLPLFHICWKQFPEHLRDDLIDKVQQDALDLMIEDAEKKSIDD